MGEVVGRLGVSVVGVGLIWLRDLGAVWVKPVGSGKVAYRARKSR